MRNPVFIRAAILVVVALLVFGCRPERPRPPPAPHVRIVVDGPELGAYATPAWAPLGFTVSFEDVFLPECPRFWYAMGQTNCQITVLVIRDQRLLELAHTEGMADRTHRTIRIDASVAADRLKIAMAHELGHILLDTPAHTDGGIMGGATWWMKPVDFALACKTIAICATPK